MPQAIRVIDQAEEIIVSAAAFSGNLSPTDVNVQLALNTLDAMSSGVDWTRVLIVDKGGKGDYLTIKEACDYVATQSPGYTTTWAIKVMPGIYYELPFTVPTYTSVIGISNGIKPLYNYDVLIWCNAEPSGSNYITLAAEATIENCSIYMQYTASKAMNAITTSGSAGRLIDCCVQTFMAGAFTHRAVYAQHNMWINNCYIARGGSPTGWVGVEVTGNRTIYVWNSQLVTNSSSGTTAFINSSTGTMVLFFNRLVAGNGTKFGLDINNAAGGTVRVNNMPYYTFSGTITHDDLAQTDIPGIMKKLTTIADLNQTISDPPTQAETQAISDKIDEILAAMRVAGMLAT